VEISHGTEEVSLTFADEWEAGLLEIPEGSACYFLNGVTFDTQNTAVDLFKGVTRTEKIKFISELRKEEK
jgi:GntR family transcriptional regulator